MLDEGRIAGIGTHEELLQNCEVYQQIAASQLSEDELKTGSGKAVSKKDGSKSNGTDRAGTVPGENLSGKEAPSHA